jgi:hypothetical protein
MMPVANMAGGFAPMAAPQLPSMPNMAMPAMRMPNLADGWAPSDSTPSWADESWKANMKSAMEAERADNASAANEERGNLKAAGYGNEKVTTPNLDTEVLNTENGGHMVISGSDPANANTYAPGDNSWQQAAAAGPQQGGGASGSAPATNPAPAAAPKNYARGWVPGRAVGKNVQRPGPGRTGRSNIPHPTARFGPGWTGRAVRAGSAEVKAMPARPALPVRPAWPAAALRPAPMPGRRAMQARPAPPVRPALAAAVARENAAIHAHRGGARPGDRPVVTYLAGHGPAVINTGEKVVPTPYGDAVLNRRMQRRLRCYSFR